MEQLIKELKDLNKVIADTNQTLEAIIQDMGKILSPEVDLEEYRKTYEKECPECGHTNGHSNSCVTVE